MDLEVLIKLDEDWPALVGDAARSAQILCSGCRPGEFGLVIGFRSTTLELRFLIVHRSSVGRVHENGQGEVWLD